MSSVRAVAGVSMNKEMIISSGAHDTRVAILEDDQVVEIFIERENQRGVVGNIYKGRVSKVLPGMQSSFVEIGLERDAFLYVSEVVNTVEEFERLAGEDEDESATADEDGRRKASAAPKPRRGEDGPEPLHGEGGEEGSPDGAADGPPANGRADRRARDRSPAREERGASRDDRPQAKIEDLLK